VRVEPGPPRESDPHSPGTMEHAVVGSGRAVIGPAGQAVELGPGDYIAYPGDVPHICDALEPGTAVVMAVEHVLRRLSRLRGREPHRSVKVAVGAAPAGGDRR
jgi:quercetin dioxygenase-like cupin family protein